MSHSFLEEYIKACNELETDSLLILWAGISALSSYCSRKKIMYGSRNIRPNFLVYLVGAPALRKSTLLKYHDTLMGERNFHHIPQGSNYEDLLIGVSQEEEPIYGNDIEKINEVPYLWIEDEFTVEAAKARDFALALCKIYDSLPYLKFRMKRKTYITQSPILNGLFATTLDGAKVWLNDRVTKTGYSSRCIFAVGLFPRKENHLPTGAEPEVLRMYQRAVKRLDMTRNTLSISSEASQVLLDLYNNPQYVVRHSAFLHYNARRQEHLVKLSGLICWNRHGNEISADDVVNANTILYVTEQRMVNIMPKRLMGNVARVAGEIYDVIAHKKEITVSEIRQVFSNEFSNAKINQAIKTLDEKGFVEVDYTNGILRIPKIYLGNLVHVNPQIQLGINDLITVEDPEDIDSLGELFKDI